jgi:hypothetical protein
MVGWHFSMLKTIALDLVLHRFFSIMSVVLAQHALIDRECVHCKVLEYPRFHAKTALSCPFFPVRWERLRTFRASEYTALKGYALVQHHSRCEHLKSEIEWDLLSEYWIKMFFKSGELFVQRGFKKGISKTRGNRAF